VLGLCCLTPLSTIFQQYHGDFEMKVVLNLEIMTSSIYKYNMRKFFSSSLPACTCTMSTMEADVFKEN
jgi:hypothetical protein